MEFGIEKSAKLIMNNGKKRNSRSIRTTQSGKNLKAQREIKLQMSGNITSRYN